MANTDPFTDFSLLVSHCLTLDLPTLEEINLQDEEYLKELQLSNFQTKQLFDELLQQQDTPLNISQVQSNELIQSTLSFTAEDKSLPIVPDEPISSCALPHKNKKINKQKKIKFEEVWEKLCDNEISREKVTTESTPKNHRKSIRIQQNGKKQKIIQTTKIKRKNKDKRTKAINPRKRARPNQFQKKVESYIRLMKHQQFQSYLNLS